MPTSPDSTFSETIFKWLNLARQLASFMPDCLTHFANMAISASKHFHKAVRQHKKGVAGPSVITFCNFPRESDSKRIIEIGQGLKELLPRVQCLPFFVTRCI